MKQIITLCVSILLTLNLAAQSADFMGVKIPANNASGYKGEPMLIVKMKKNNQSQLGADMNDKVERLKEIPYTEAAKFDHEMNKQKELWQSFISKASEEQNDFLKSVAQYNLAFIYIFTDNIAEAEKISEELRNSALHKDGKAKIARLVEIYKKKPLQRPEIAEAYVELEDEEDARMAKKSKIDYKKDIVSINGTDAYKIVKNNGNFEFTKLDGSKFLNVEIMYFHSTCNGVWYKAVDNDGRIAYFEANPTSLREGANMARFLSSENYVVTPTGEINSVAYEKAMTQGKENFDKIMQKHNEREKYNSLLKAATKNLQIKFGSSKILYTNRKLNYDDIVLGDIFIRDVPLGEVASGVQVVVMRNDTIIAQGTLDSRRDGGKLTTYKIYGQGDKAIVQNAGDIIFDRCACSPQNGTDNIAKAVIEKLFFEGIFQDNNRKPYYRKEE